MKAFPTLLVGALALLAGACQRHSDETLAPTPVEDPDWLRLEIPGGREARAVAGSLDQTLVVTTYTKAYYTTNRGQTWQESYDFRGSVPGLATRHDTMVALTGSATDAQNRHFATAGFTFTTDFGRTWQHTNVVPYGTYAAFRDILQRTDLVQATSGFAYQVKHNLTPDSPGSLSGQVNPSDLLRVDASGTHTLRLPGKHILNNLHLDAQNRLYVAASGGAYIPESNGVIGGDPASPAVIYVSRRPLP